MAFTLQVVRGSTTYNLTSPFSLESADGIGGAPVRNIEDSGPFQDGATHLGERLDPRTITLSINIVGASASALDGHRDTLNTMFKPVTSVPIQLKLTRDDGAIRQIDCRRVGPMDIPLVPMNRPGNLHRAVVQLRAVEPTWYNPTMGTVTLAAQNNNWWLAGGTIGTASVLEHAESPSQGQLWTHSGSVAAGQPWTVFFRSALETLVAGSVKYAFDFAPDDGGVGHGNFLAADPNYTAQAATDLVINGAALMTSGSQNYYVVTTGSSMTAYRGTVVLGTDPTGSASGIAIAGTSVSASRWRKAYDNAANTQWSADLPFAASYNIALNAAQMLALGTSLVAYTGETTDLVYQGDFDSYPIVAITGPLTDPIIINTAISGTLDFTGGTISGGDTWTVDTRYGHKTAVNGSGSSVLNYLTTASTLSTFRIVPAPVASGGTNTISVNGTNRSTATSVTITYYNRYFSF
jgi:hypothetical protein